MTTSAISLVLPGGLSAEADIGDPVALPAREARLDVLAFERSGRAAKPRRVDVFQRVDAHDCVEAMVDLAGDEWDRAATRADVKGRRSRPEGVFGHEAGIADRDRQSRAGIGRPDSAMLYAEGAIAGARGNFLRVTLPFEPEGDVAAVTLAVEKHANLSELAIH